MILLAAGAAGRLGGGGGPDIPVLRLVLAFVTCALIAGLAILLLRQRYGKGGDLPALFRRAAHPRHQAAIDVVEVRRLSPHADIGLVRHAGREYLLVVQAGAASILNSRDHAPPEPEQ